MKAQLKLLSFLCITGMAMQLGHAETEAKTLQDQFEVHGVLTLSSDYRSRGFSKSNHKPSVQGGLMLTHQSGAYLMLWGASAATPTGGNIEADAIVGYTWALNEKNSLDFSYADVNYPGGDFSPNGKTADFGEFAVVYKRKDSLKENDHFSAGAYYSPKYMFGSGNEYYLNSEYSYPLKENIQLFGAVGYTKQDSVADFQLGTAFDANQSDYFDYKVGLRADFKGVTGELAWVDNNIDSQQKMYDGRVYFSVTKNF